jgi:hypothetical protein
MIRVPLRLQKTYRVKQSCVCKGALLIHEQEGTRRLWRRVP